MLDVLRLFLCLLLRFLRQDTACHMMSRYLHSWRGQATRPPGNAMVTSGTEPFHLDGKVANKHPRA